MQEKYLLLYTTISSVDVYCKSIICFTNSVPEKAWPLNLVVIDIVITLLLHILMVFTYTNQIWTSKSNHV